MTRIYQGIIVSGAILASIVGILVAADAGANSQCPAQFSKWFACVLNMHEGLAAGLIGAGGALFAAWLAWSAIFEQINSTIDLATRREREVFLAVRAECKELYAALNLAWRAVDVALAVDWRTLFEVNYALVAGITRILPPVKNLDALSEIGNQLSPMERRGLLLTLNSVRWIYQQKDNVEAGEPVGVETEDRLWRLRHLRTMLSHFLKYLDDFDPESAALFAGRKRDHVDHRVLAEHLRPSVEKAERGENWLT